MAIRMPWAGGPDPEDALELKQFDPGFRGTWAWEQPARFRARWRLTCDGAPVAVLATRRLFVAPTSARFADATWEVRLRFPVETVVTRVGEPEPWGRFRQGWFGSGRLARTHDTALSWRPNGFLRPTWSFTTPELIPLVTFHRSRSFLLHGATIELEEAARRMPDLPALLVLGWLLVMRVHRGHAGRY